MGSIDAKVRAEWVGDRHLRVTLGEDASEDELELDEAIIDLKALLLFDLDGVLEYDCWLPNFGCE